MKIDKSKLQTLWYQDKDGNEVDADSQNICYQVSRFPLEVRTMHLKMVRKEDVDACKHQHKYIKRTFGWIKGIKGRECQLCHGTQVRKWWQPWGRKWDAYGSREVFTSISTVCEKTILAMVESEDYTLSEAMIVYSEACERCANVLAYRYSNGKEGYAEGSEEWKKCKTSCEWCKEDNNG